MTAPTRTGDPSSPMEVLLRRAAIPATARLVVDLQTRRPVAVTVSGDASGEPMDAVTIARALHALAAHRGRPDAPAIFEVPLGTLLGLPSAGQYSEHPLIVSLAAGELLDHPAQSLQLVERARELGWEIGLHGVGADPASLAAVGVFEPSLVIIDPVVLADPTSPLAAELLHTVTAFRHATGSTVMAEHLDSAPLLATAVALGATIGHGAAAPCTGTELPSELDYTLDLFFSPRLPDPAKSPFEISTQRHQSQRAAVALLLSASRKIERAAAGAGRSAVVLAAFQDQRRITPATRSSYRELTGRNELIMMTATGLRSTPVPGVCWAGLDRHDHLRNEWVVLVQGPVTSVLLAARQVEHRRRHDERAFDYVLSFDRDLVAHAARSLLSRLPRRNDG